MGTSTRARPLHRALASAAGALLLLAGCSDEPAAAPAPLAKQEPAAGASPTPTQVIAPELPPAARGGSNAAAVAFVEHYIDVLNYTAATLDTTPLEELSADDCEACAAIATRMQTLRKNSGSIDGGKWSVLQAVVLPVQNSTTFVVEAVVDCDEQRVIERAGAESVVHPEGKTAFYFSVRHSGSKWMVHGLQSGS